MSYENIELSVDGPVGELVLRRPDVRNAMTREMGEEIERAVADIDAARDLRVLLVRGEGKAFSAGGDFAYIEERTRCGHEENRRAMGQFYRKFLSIRRVRVPTIAVVHGPAVGAGLCFAMACDVRLAAPGVKMGVNFVRIGLHPGMGATHLLPALVGPAKAAELLLTGKLIESDEAERIGLVNAVYATAEVEPAARAMAEQIATAAPVAVAQTRETLHKRLDRQLEQALDREADAQAVDYATEDMAEGIRAFKEKRTPEFRGR